MQSNIIIITVKDGVVQGVYKSTGETVEGYEIIDYDVLKIKNDCFDKEFQESDLLGITLGELPA